MNISEARTTVERQAHEFETLRRRLVHTAIEAHLDHGVGANAIATTLAATAGGPGWGRDRVLALLAAARTARSANSALQAANLGRVAVAAHTEPHIPGEHEYDFDAPDTVARLHLLTGARLGTGGATALLATLSSAGVTIDATDPEAALAAATKATPPLYLKPIPRP